MKRIDYNALDIAMKAEQIIGRRLDDETRQVIATAFRIGYRQALVAAAKKAVKGDKAAILSIGDEEVPSA